MTSARNAKRDRKRKAALNVVERAGTLAVLWTLLIAATGGCRCGTIEHQQSEWTGGVDDMGSSRSVGEPFEPSLSTTRPPSSDEKDQAARVDAIKTDILSKLGIDSTPDVVLSSPGGSVDQELPVRGR